MQGCCPSKLWECVCNCNQTTFLNCSRFGVEFRCFPHNVLEFRLSQGQAFPNVMVYLTFYENLDINYLFFRVLLLLCL